MISEFVEICISFGMRVIKSMLLLFASPRYLHFAIGILNLYVTRIFDYLGLYVYGSCRYCGYTCVHCKYEMFWGFVYAVNFW